MNLAATIDRPSNLSVEVNGDIFHNLHLFANPLDARRPSAKEIKRAGKKGSKLVYRTATVKSSSVSTPGPAGYVTTSAAATKFAARAMNNIIFRVTSFRYDESSIPFKEYVYSGNTMTVVSGAGRGERVVEHCNHALAHDATGAFALLEVEDSLVYHILIVGKNTHRKEAQQFQPVQP